MIFGAPTWPFRWNPPYDKAIRRIAGAGFRATELVAWNREVIDTYYTPATIRELKTVLDGEGVFLSQFCTHPRGLSSEDGSIRAGNVEHWKKAVEIGHALGSPIINMVSHHPFGMTDGNEVPRIMTRPLVQQFTLQAPEGADWQANYEDYVHAVRQCAEACGGAGLGMTIEPHPFRYVANNASALRLIEKTDHPALGINFDPSHTFPCGEFPNVSIYQLGRYVRHCHVSDNDGTTNAHWRPGKGKIDWYAMFKALKETGYDGVISVELEDVPGVSQPANNARREPAREDATEDFLSETVKGADYLREICSVLGIAVE